MAEKKKEETNSSLIPGNAPANSIGSQQREEEMSREILAAFERLSSPPSLQQMLQIAEMERRIITASDMMKRSPSVSMMSDSSMYGPPSVPFLSLTQRASPFLLPPRVSVNSESSMKKPPDSQLLKTPSELSTASTVSVKSESSMFEPPFFDPLKTQSEPFSETDSTVSSVSMRSDSSMYKPPSFNLKRKQSQLTEELSSCAVCEEAGKDPVRLLCGHKSCKQCVLSFRDQNGSTADYPCKKCGRRFKGEPEHQTDSEDDEKNLKLPSASRPAPQNTTGPVGREKRDPDLQSVLLKKKIKRVEMETEKLQAEKETFQAEKEKLQSEKEKLQAEKETFQAEKEKSQAEKEKSQAEKEKFQAEKEKSQAEKEKFQAEKEKFELEKRKLALEIQSLELKGSYTN